MDYAALRVFIEADARGVGYAAMAAAGNDAGLAAALNARQGAGASEIVEAVSRNRFAIWCASSGQRAVIEDHATNVQSPLRSAALSIRDFLLGQIGDALVLTDGTPQRALLDAWVAAGAMTGEQRDELLALATVTVSEAEAAFGRGIVVTHQDVALALRPQEE